MLRRLENGDVTAALSFFSDSAVSVRIKANLSVYKADYPFAEFWAQYDENGNITAVMSKVNGVCTIDFSSDADTEELISFMSFISCNSLFLDKEKAQRLCLREFSSGDILCLDGKCDAYVEGISDNTDMKEAFQLISDNEGKSIAKLDYLEWLSDYTFKANRNAARLRAVMQGDELISLAMTSAETQSAGIISGVFTKKEYRNKGYGERVLRAISQSLIKDNKKVYIMTAEEKMSAYYEKRGFKKVGCWAEVKF